MPSQPSNPFDCTPGGDQPVETTMQKRDLAPGAEIREVLREAIGGVFPGQLLELLLGRLERGQA